MFSFFTYMADCWLLIKICLPFPKTTARLHFPSFLADSWDQGKYNKVHSSCRWTKALGAWPRRPEAEAGNSALLPFPVGGICSKPPPSSHDMVDDSSPRHGAMTWRKLGPSKTPGGTSAPPPWSDPWDHTRQKSTYTSSSHCNCAEHFWCNTLALSKEKGSKRSLRGCQWLHAPCWATVSRRD